MSGVCAGSSGRQVGKTLPGRPFTVGRTHTHPHSLNTGKFHVHIFGMWEKMSIQRKPTKTWQNTQITQTVIPAGIHSFFHQSYNEMLLNKTTLFEGLLYIYGGKGRGGGRKCLKLDFKNQALCSHVLWEMTFRVYTSHFSVRGIPNACSGKAPRSCLGLYFSSPLRLPS